MVYPSKWQQCGGGEGIDQFREDELNSARYSRFNDHTDSYEIFSGVNVVGGVNYFLWDKDKTNSEVRCCFNKIETTRNFLSDGLPIQIRDPELLEIVKNKIQTKTSFARLVGSRVFYGDAVANAVDVESAAALTLDSFPEEDTVKVFYVRMGQKIKSIKIARSLTKRDVDDYKVFVSKAVHGKFDEFMPRADRILYGSPGEIASDTFLKVGSFTSEQEAVNAVRYLKTNFCNFLLAVVSPTQVTNFKSYMLIPDVNFFTGEIYDKPGVFLDFGSPGTLDEQLSNVYGLTDEERHTMVKDLKLWKNKVDVHADR